jgi:hypothetical protein
MRGNISSQTVTFLDAAPPHKFVFIAVSRSMFAKAENQTKLALRTD